MSIQDKAKCLYGDKINSLFPGDAQISLESEAEVEQRETSLKKGWSLKGKKKQTVFSEKQKNYVKSKYEIGKRTGNKIDPYVAAQQMQEEKENGEYVFKSTEYLTGQQISSFFSRLSMKERSLEILDMRASEEEDTKTQLKMHVLKTISSL